MSEMVLGCVLISDRPKLVSVDISADMSAEMSVSVSVSVVAAETDTIHYLISSFEGQNS